jgi:streptomycin 6-kinase
VNIPGWLVSACRKPEQRAWLANLPQTVRTLQRRWQFTFESHIEPYPASCAWVTRVVLSNGEPAVLKLGLPHMEAESEMAGLRFWNGDPTVRLLAFEKESGGMLLERCRPGTPLQALTKPEQDAVIASLLRRLWRLPEADHPFRRLAVMTEFWAKETIASSDRWPDQALVRDGLQLLRTLPESASCEVLLATDLHAGNVLRAEREPWLVIDPKPFVGDPAYDATQHLLNCQDRLRADARGTIERLADLLGLDGERIRLWTFARLAAEPRADWEGSGQLEVARRLA